MNTNDRTRTAYFASIVIAVAMFLVWNMIAFPSVGAQGAIQHPIFTYAGGGDCFAAWAQGHTYSMDQNTDHCTNGHVSKYGYIRRLPVMDTVDAPAEAIVIITTTNNGDNGDGNTNSGDDDDVLSTSIPGSVVPTPTPDVLVEETPVEDTPCDSGCDKEDDGSVPTCHAKDGCDDITNKTPEVQEPCIVVVESTK